MSDREWNLANSMGYTFIAFAGVTDWKLEDAEKGAVYSVLRNWCPDSMSNDDVTTACTTAHGWLMEDLKKDKDSGTIETVAKNMAGLVSWFKKVFEDGENPEKLKKFFLGDLVKIAMADDHFHETEKSWIGIIAKQLDVEYQV